MANIVCRHQIENELFITSEGKVWPCCNLQDEQVSGKMNIIEKIGLKNDLKETSFYEIIRSDCEVEEIREEQAEMQAMQLEQQQQMMAAEQAQKAAPMMKVLTESEATESAA